MAITFFAAGAVITAASGNVTVAQPASTLADDIGIVVVSQFDNVVSTVPAGWNKVGELNNGTGLRTWWGWKRYGAAEGSLVITHTAGGNIISQISVFRGVVRTGNPHETSSQSANASSATITALAITPAATDDHILFIWGATRSDGVATYTGTNPTFTERMDAQDGAQIISMGLASGDKNDATTTGGRTATAARAGINNGYLVALVGATLPGRRANIGQAVQRASTWRRKCKGILVPDIWLPFPVGV